MSHSNDAMHEAEMERTGFWGKRGAGCLVLALNTERILYVKRSSHVLEPNTWGTVGGAIDRNEDVQDAVLRELKEETGYTGSYKANIHLYTFVDNKTGFKYYNQLIIIPDEYKCNLNWENSDYEWLPLGKYPPRNQQHFGLVELLKHCDLKQVCLDWIAKHT